MLHEFGFYLNVDPGKVSVHAWAEAHEHGGAYDAADASMSEQYLNRLPDLWETGYGLRPGYTLQALKDAGLVK